MLNSESFSAFLSSTLDDLLAALGPHTDQEAMVLTSFSFIRLKCSLHLSISARK